MAKMIIVLEVEVPEGVRDAKLFKKLVRHSDHVVEGRLYEPATNPVRDEDAQIELGMGRLLQTSRGRRYGG
jgi:hypothetical protein